MSRHNEYFAISKIYTYVWSKYRPALLQLMIASAEGPQEYKFSDHEFRRINPREKGYSFTLRIFQGKAINDIRTSPPAKDLLVVLQQSKKASELAAHAVYQFTLDKRFVLHITREEQTTEAIASLPLPIN